MTPHLVTGFYITQSDLFKGYVYQGAVSYSLVKHSSQANLEFDGIEFENINFYQCFVHCLFFQANCDTPRSMENTRNTQLKQLPGKPAMINIICLIRARNNVYQQGDL